MLTPFFVREPGQPVNNFADATSGNADAYASFFHAMLENGVFLPPSQYEAFFVGLAHTDEAIERTIRAAEKSFAAVGASGEGVDRVGKRDDLRVASSPCELRTASVKRTLLSLPQ